ncbi:hypothetical protein [Rhizobium sp. CC-YZS058]|nr:hypothetical protein [Rhizobium sp. CC-YZS058]MEA3535154.1 hypothetical protein [Rhizobium sp. CC-YZS058]
MKKAARSDPGGFFGIRSEAVEQRGAQLAHQTWSSGGMGIIQTG